MLGFPQKTELRKPLHKKAIFDRLKLNKAQQDRVDADISRLWFVNEISPFSVGIAAGEEVKAFFVILVSLKSKEYDDKTITMLFRMIDNKMILVLEYEGESRVAIFRGKLIQTDWNPTESYFYSLQGLNLDSVWNNLVVQIGDIKMEADRSLDEQIAVDDQRAKIQKEIERLERLARAEKQPKKKFELVQRIKMLKEELEG